jgi:ArsR family transcriptional regulator, arsenate/arsenite/antimonite-responsive transcriptional repressor
MEIESLAKALKVLGEPTRLSIFDMLMEGVHCNCEIAERLGLSLSLVSHHLGALSQHGLIYGERASSDARWIYYRIDREALEQLTGAIDQMLDGARIKPRQPVCGHPPEGDAKTPGK